MTEIINVETCFVKTKVENHSEIKQSLLEQIESIGTHNIVENNQKISNTDWHLNSNYKRNYIEIIHPLLQNHLDIVKEKLMLIDNLKIINFWFQQYNFLDYHNWHTHNLCFFSSVYYVELPEKSSKTSFKFLNKEFESDVKEGDILTFPSIYLHCSKTNQSQKTKTVISFNSNCYE